MDTIVLNSQAATIQPGGSDNNQGAREASLVPSLPYFFPPSSPSSPWPSPSPSPWPPTSPHFTATPAETTMGPITQDARNVLTALALYCDLLDRPGVLTPEFTHYAAQLKVVVESGVALLERTVATTRGTRKSTEPTRKHTEPALKPTETTGERLPQRRVSTGSHRLCQFPMSPKPPARRAPRPCHAPAFLIDLGAEVERRRAMLGVVLGARVSLEIDCLPCAGAVHLSSDHLGRILMNLVRNAGEAMPGGGRVRISLQAAEGASFLPPGSPASQGSKKVLLCVQDNGPGIAPEYLRRIFERDITIKESVELGATATGPDGFGPPPSSRGLGLGIVRGLVEAAGGTMRAHSRPGLGTRFEMEFPLGPRLAPAPAKGTRKEVQC